MRKNLLLVLPFVLTSVASEAQTVTAPTPVAVTPIAANGSYGVGASVNVIVNFTSPVIVTGTPQLALNSGGSASYASGSGTNRLVFTYVVTNGQSSSRLDYISTRALTLNGGSIGGGTPATLILPRPGAPGSLGANSNLAIDTTAPLATSIQVLFGAVSYRVWLARRRTTYCRLERRWIGQME